jgi:DNA polymerase-1
VEEKNPTAAICECVEKRDGLNVYAAEEISGKGTCPGGTYQWHDCDDDAVRLFSSWVSCGAWSAVDIETGGSDEFSSQIFLLSVSVKTGEAHVFDHRYLWQFQEYRDALKRFLTKCKIVCHNSSFEQSFFLGQMGCAANVRGDTLIMHQILSAGLTDKSDLGSLLQRYLGLEADKQWQKFFLRLHPSSPIPNDAVRYSAGDVCRLLELYAILHKELEKEGLLRVWQDIERPLLPIIAQARHHGISVDTEFLASVRVELERGVHECLKRFWKLTGVRMQMGEDGVPHSAPKVNIGSWQQITELFYGLGAEIQGTDEEALSKVTRPKRAVEVANAVLQYRGLSKVLGTYVNPLMGEHLNPKTGRIHPTWKQCSTDTGRMACARPNMQNIPSKGEWVKIRQAIVARPGHKLIIADYSQMELRVLAQLSQEPKLLEAFRTGADLHTQTARILYGGEEPSKEQRSFAKTFNFAVSYGAGPPTLAQQTGLSIKDASKLFDKFFSGYPTLKAYLDRSAQFAKDNLYSVTPAGRKRYYTRPDREDMRQYVRRMDAIGREGCNMPVQGCNADITKLASIAFHERTIKERDDVKLLMWVHDEVVLEVSADPMFGTPEAYGALLRECMIEAARPYLPDVPVEVSMVISDCWEKG